MCGISGAFLARSSFSEGALREIGHNMSQTLRHRGPDSGGVWVDNSRHVLLSHRRLSILDLSKAGSQPMLSESGRYTICYNGEVYNYGVIKAELQKRGEIFVGNSDTEVILRSIEIFGITEALEKFVGMFAFALWDSVERTLILARDRFGIKPLYYGWVGESLIFGSELKALKQFPGFDNRINKSALAMMINYGNVPAPHSIYESVGKVTPGTYLTFSSKQIKSPVSCSYWCSSDLAIKGMESPMEISDRDAIDQLDVLIGDAVELRMISDVNVGAFLSGGYDSSMVVAQMQKLSSRKVKTFSIGFHEKEYNEAHYAKEISGYLKTDHTELYVTAEDLIDTVPLMSSIYDEPFSDSSQIPTFIMSKLAREHVTVCLSGDGGDELFGGYSRHLWTERLWQKISWMGDSARFAIANLLLRVSPERWDAIVKCLSLVTPEKYSFNKAGRKIHKFAEFLSVDSEEAIYEGLLTRNKSFLGDEYSAQNLALDRNHIWSLEAGSLTEKIMVSDLINYLPNDILTKVDRATMGVGLEGRVPLLDHRVAEFAWGLPLNMKVRDGRGKWVFRELLYKYVPRHLLDRPKSGFDLPLGQWFRGALRDWGEAHINEQKLNESGFFDPKKVRKMWDLHVSGKRDFQYHLWDILMFLTWYEANS